MRASVGFIFFMLFLAGLALVNLQGMKDPSDGAITSASDIADTAWRTTHIGEMRLPDDSQLTVEFNADDSVAGHGGCNRFFGAYKFSKGAFSIGLVGTTRMACSEQITAFEISFLEALQSTRILSRADSRLTMRNEQSDVVARFLAIERDNQVE